MCYVSGWRLNHNIYLYKDGTQEITSQSHLPMFCSPGTIDLWRGQSTPSERRHPWGKGHAKCQTFTVLARTNNLQGAWLLFTVIKYRCCTVHILCHVRMCLINNNNIKGKIAFNLKMMISLINKKCVCNKIIKY